MELTVDTFLGRRFMRAVLRADHISHPEGVSPYAWHAMSCERVGRTVEGGSERACQGLTLVTPDGASHLLNTYCNIAEVGQLLLYILVGRAPPFEETLDWLQLMYTANRT